MSDFRARWVAPDGASRLLHGPGDLSRCSGGALVLHGEPEYEYEAGSWCIAVSTFVLRRHGEVKWETRS